MLAKRENLAFLLAVLRLSSTTAPLTHSFQQHLQNRGPTWRGRVRFL